jgi:N-methylhydantoinase A
MAKVLTFDMGGTTAKAGSVIDGEPDVAYEFEAAGRTHSGRSIRGSGYVVRGPFIDIAEVSAGGGTVARVDDGGDLTVGPMSAGAEPGPACYGRGGREPTVTDANVVLGRINPSYLLGGKMRIFSSMASRAYRMLAAELGMTVEEAAEGVVRLVNSGMSKAISIVSVERGRDPREFSMIAFGGAGPVHCCDLAEELGIREVIVPVHAGLFSAYGLLAGNLTRTFTLPVSPRNPSIAGCFAELERTAKEAMRRDGFKRFASRRYVEARYAGQSHELALPFTGITQLRTAFDRAHKRLYGYSTHDRVEVVNAKLRAVVERSRRLRLSSSWEDGRPRATFRRAWFSGGLIRVPVYTRERMRLGDHGVGPCIIEEYDSTLVVNPRWRWRLEEYGTRLTR